MYICINQIIKTMHSRIKEVIKKQGTTVQELAEKMGISRVGLSQHINGNPSVEVLERIATALDVPLWQLFASPEEVAKETKGETCPYCGQPIIIKTTIEKA
ncbi:helix-turn-helix domain-containing protein [Phocaeicola vulgatus]|jgi:transcriptional regulator with XRE-family HTH domain